MRERLSGTERKVIEDLWDQWDAARDPHEKAKLQMRLGETVASWMSHADALEREVEEWRDRYYERDERDDRTDST